MTSLGRSNTYEFKFKGKKIMSKPVKLKPNVRNNDGTVTDKNNKTTCYLVTRCQSSLEALVDTSVSTLRNSIGLLSLLIGTKPIVTVESPASHLLELHVHTKRQMTFINYNYQSTAKSHKQLQELVIGDGVLIRVHPERLPLGTLKRLHTRCSGPHKVLKRFDSTNFIFPLILESVGYSAEDLPCFRTPVTLCPALPGLTLFTPPSFASGEFFEFGEI